MSLNSKNIFISFLLYRFTGFEKQNYLFMNIFFNFMFNQLKKNEILFFYQQALFTLVIFTDENHRT